MKRVLITGSSGMLGCALVEAFSRKYDVYASAGHDFEGNSAKQFKLCNLKDENYHELVHWANPDAIVHCAAMIDGNYCEQHPDEAMRVNGYSVKKLCEAAPNTRLIYISSDAVFPMKTHLAKEEDITGSEHVYGQSKELGEKLVKESSRGDCCIVRTTIVGKNNNPSRKQKGLVDWVVSSLKEGKTITLFEDVFITPISIWHLAEELEWIMENNVPQTLHVPGKDIVSKYDLGYELCKKLGMDVSLIKKGSIDDMPSRSKRSKDLTLDGSLYERLSNRQLPGKDVLIRKLANKYQELK